MHAAIRVAPPLVAALALAIVAAMPIDVRAQALPAPAGARQPSAADLRYLRGLGLPAVTIADVVLNLNGVATDIGDIDVTAAPDPTNAYTIMDATFRLDPAQSRLRNWITFHWVQAITADGCPAPYAGRPLPFGQMDPPHNGWDYMYFDRAARTMPDLRIPNYGWFVDDRPWYYNATGEGAMFVPGVSYSVQDAPTHCSDGSATAFATWLVAECAGQCFCLIRGFTWTISSTPALRAGPTDAGVPALAHATAIGAALANAHFTGWSVAHGCQHDYGFDALVSVDPVARRIGFALQVVGPSRGLSAIFMANSVNPPLPTVFGSLYLDAASLVVLATLPLNAAGFGELRPSVVAATYPDLALQAVTTDGITTRLTNYAMIGTHANAAQTEILAARYDGARDLFQVVCKGTPGDLVEVLLLHPAALPRSLGSFTVPPAPTMITFTHTEPGFQAGDTLEVWNRTRGARLMQMQ